MNRKRSIPSVMFLGIAVALILLVFVLPYLHLILTSFKNPVDTLSVPPTFIPERLSIESYKNIFKFPHVVKAFPNSIIISLLSTMLAMVFAIPAAYAVSRYGSKLGRIFLVGVLLTRMIPYISLAIPIFLIMRNVGLTDTHLGVALAHTTVNLPLAIWMLSSFFESFPTTLEEAAIIDGCSRFRALYRIVIPTMIAGISVTALFCFLTSWNEFLFSLLLTSVNSKTIPIAISEFKTQYGVDWGTMTALATMFSLPVVIVSMAIQRHIVAGMTAGASKE